jgi:predicted lipid-binding transport protein (Tim44 family)
MRILTLLTLVLLTFSLTMPDAEARRLGGGSSFGKQRNSLNLNRQQKQSNAQQGQQPPGNAANPTAAAAATGGASKWLGPLAGLAAGGLLASLFMGGAFDGINMADMLILVGIMAAIFFGIRMMRRAKGGHTQPMQYSSAGQSMGGAPLSHQDTTPSSGGFSTGNSGQSASTDTLDVPADFDVDNFLKNAKGSFITLQLAHDSGDLEEIRAFTTPELFAEISRQMAERSNSSQQTDVTYVEAALLDITMQADHAIASVRFTGELREAPNAPLEPFDEIWHVEKDLTASDSAWLLAGIQQTADVKH